MRALVFHQATLPRTLPFALFMAFIAVDEIIRHLANLGLVSISHTSLYYLYPIKTIAVAALIYKYRREYEELDVKDLADIKTTCIVLLVGILSCVIWVMMDWTIVGSGSPPGFNPTHLPVGPIRFIMTQFRIAGAVLVVPLMEELFWRSFLLRYIIDADFKSVKIGQFSWPSFIFTLLLFGLEHHFVLVGMVVGAVYSMILYKTRSLAQCVLSHAVTNLALAGYVLYTGKWYFW